jgi:hypothetical protein
MGLAEADLAAGLGFAALVGAGGIGVGRVDAAVRLGFREEAAAASRAVAVDARARRRAS